MDAYGQAEQKLFYGPRRSEHFLLSDFFKKLTFYYIKSLEKWQNVLGSGPRLLLMHVYVVIGVKVHIRLFGFLGVTSNTHTKMRNAHFRCPKRTEIGPKWTQTLPQTILTTLISPNGVN